MSAPESGPAPMAGLRRRLPPGCSSAPVRCTKCGLDYDEVGWLELPLERVIEPSELRRLVLNWPGGTRVEVRRCRGCTALISVKRLLALM